MTKNNKYKFVKIFPTICYILECKGGYLLIDVSYPQNYIKFIQKLKKKYGIDISEIKYLLLTHHHDDHAGFAAELLKNTKAKLIVHANALERLKKGASEEDSKPINKRIKTMFSLFSRFHEFKYPPVLPSEGDIIMRGTEDNTEILRSLGIDGTIVFSPGHTGDGISVILSDGSIFPGDNAMNAWFFNIFGIKKRPIYVQDIELVFNSWERYIELDGKIVYPAHGKPFDINHLQKNIRRFRNGF